MKKKKVLGCILGCAIVVGAFFAGSNCADEKTADLYSSNIMGNALVESTGDANYDTASYSTNSYSTDSYSAKSLMSAVPDSTSQNEDPSATVTESEAASEETTRKLITTMNMSVEVKDAASYDRSLQKLVAQYKGYIESSSIGPDYSNDGATKQYQYTIRIPAANFKDFLSSAQDNVSVTDQSTQTQDVTLTYTDMEAHKRALKAEEATLEELFSKAETTDDLIKIQTQLTDVRYQLDSLESQLRVYDNQVDYSTLNLTVSQVQAYSPVKDQSFGEQVTSGIKSTLSEMQTHVKAAAIWFLTELPRLIITAVIILIAICVIRGRLKKRKKKSNMPAQTAQSIADKTEPDHQSTRSDGKTA